MRALVTGGSGFIGSNLVDGLLAAGHEVSVLDDLSTGRRSNLEHALGAGAVLHEIDVTDATGVLQVVADFAPDAVFHLAAQIDVRRSVEDPAFDARVNLEGTLNVLEAARREGVSRFVYTSTGGALYGDAEVIPTPEDAPVRPLAPYGMSKYAAEQACALYARLHGLSTVTLRYGNVYGPRQDPLGEAGVVAIFCGLATFGGRATIYGDGHQTRDYVYVGDVVAANLAAVRSDARGAYNIGTGEETSVLELLAALRDLAPHRPLTAEHAPPRPGEVVRSCLACGRATRELGWRAETTLAEGLSRTLRATPS